MKADGPLAITLALAAILALPGCWGAPEQLAAANAQNRELAQQNRPNSPNSKTSRPTCATSRTAAFARSRRRRCCKSTAMPPAGG